jgi:phage terminase large subunit
MTTIEYRTYDAHPKQGRFHKALRTHTDVLFNGGRGSGKTTAGAIQSILEAVQYQPGTRGIVVAPTYPMLEDASMKEFFFWLPRHLIRDYNKQRKILELTNHSEIAFRSAENPDSLRGPNRAWAWMDEPRNLRTREAFDIISAQLRPTRKIWLTTTPAGIFHWLYDLFIQAPLDNSAVVDVRTSENPYLPPSYERGLRAQYTGQFALQELDALWVSFEGLIYSSFSIQDDGNVSSEADYNPDWPIIWGVDDGYAKGEGVGTAGYHPRVILLMQQTPIGGVNVFAEYVATQELAERSLDNVLAWRYPRPEIAYVDSSAVELKARIWEKDISATGATHSVSEGIKNVRRLVCDGNGVRLLKVHSRCTNLIREMQSYRYDENSKQVNAGEPKPLKMDDHAVDALRYGTWHLRFGL